MNSVRVDSHSFLWFKALSAAPGTCLPFRRPPGPAVLSGVAILGAFRAVFRVP
jgi:hypothetical protein